MKFVKIDNYWWRLEGSKLFNIVGGHQYASWHNIKDEDIVEVDDWEDLNWLGTDILNDKFKTGWINREGILFGCDNQCHLRQAELVHRKSEEDLELKGWIKVYKSSFFRSDFKNGLNFLIVKNRINEVQRNMLHKLNFTDKEIEGR